MEKKKKMSEKERKEVIEKHYEGVRKELEEAVAALGECGGRGQRILLGLNSISADVAGLDLAFAKTFATVVRIMGEGHINGTVRMVLHKAAQNVDRATATTVE